MAPLLDTLDDYTLTTRLRELAGDERNLLVDFLFHLAELDERKSHVRDGYSSLWDFCTRGLHLGEGAAGRRIAAMRVLAQFPQVEAPLREGRLNLSSLNLLGPVLTEDNVEELIGRAAFKSRNDVDTLAASVRPREAKADGLRRVAAPSPVAPALPATTFASRPDALALPMTSAPEPAALPLAPSPAPAPESAVTVAPLATPEPVPAPRPSELRAVTGEQWSLRVTLDAEARADLETLKSLLSHKHPSGNLSEVIKEALRCAVEKHGKRRGTVRPKAGRSRPQATGPTSPVAVVGEPHPADDLPAPTVLAHIPQEVRRRVFERDGGRCTYVAPDGTRCTSRHQLELDHIQPKALGGQPTVEGLRLRCRPHNLYAAELVFGRRHMDRFRRNRRSGAQPEPLQDSTDRGASTVGA